MGSRPMCKLDSGSSIYQCRSLQDYREYLFSRTGKMGRGKSHYMMGADRRSVPFVDNRMVPSQDVRIADYCIILPAPGQSGTNSASNLVS
jgi:hypothetical protein